MTTTDASVEAIPIPDPALPGVGDLLGAQGRSLVEEFLRRRALSLDYARPVQAIYRPGRSMIVRHRVRARTSAGHPRAMSLSLERRTRPHEPIPVDERFVDRSGSGTPVERLGDALGWIFPYDPSLPGLAEAAWGPSIRPWAGPTPAVVSAQAVRYRPRSRAVFRYSVLDPRTGRRRHLFGKTMRRSRARILRRMYLPPSAPVSLPMASVNEGTLLFEPARGRSLRELLLTGEILPRPRRVAALLHSLEGTTLARRVVQQPSAQASAAADLIRLLVPSAHDDALRVASAAAEGSREPTQLGAVHGDLYEAQIFVRDDFSLSLIDLDDAGLGDPLMEAANLTSHLLALALAAPRSSSRLLAYRSILRPALLDACDGSDVALRWREALVMLRLAPGPFRVLQPGWPRQVRRRVGLAVRILEGL